MPYSRSSPPSSRIPPDFVLQPVGAIGDQYDHETRPFLPYDLHGALQGAFARPRPAQHVVENGNGVHPDEGWLIGGDMPFLEHDIGRSIDLVAIGHRPPFAPISGREAALARSLHQMVVPQAILDQVAYGADLEPVLFGEGHQVVQPGHRPVIVHDFANDA